MLSLRQLIHYKVPIYRHAAEFQRCTMNVKELFRQAEDILKQAGLPNSRRTVVWIFCDVLDCEPAHLITYEDIFLTDDQVAEILKMTERCATHEPVQYVIGHTEFYGSRLYLSPEVLIPRPETEQLVELSLKVAKKSGALRVLDIGSGSGCIALAIKQAIPDAKVTACDICASALRIAKMNAQENGLDIQMVLADVLAHDFVTIVGDRYDLVIANPPYIPENERSELPRMVRDYEPEIALFCGDDPLKFYRAITKHLERNLLDDRGVLTLETHAEYADSVGSLLRQQGDLRVQVKKDLSGLSRFVIAESYSK